MKLLRIMLVLALLLTLPGCAEAPPVGEDPAAPPDMAEEAPGFELAVVLGGEPTSLDPALCDSLIGGNYILHMYEGLMKLGQPEEGQDYAPIVCGQAESYQISEDGLTYTFKLRDDIFWSDGQPVEAEQFVLAWRRLADSSLHSPSARLMEIVENGAAVSLSRVSSDKLGISAPDARTVKVKLTQPCSYFLEICAHFATVPVRGDMLSKAGPSWAAAPASYIGNGPFQLAEWTAESQLVCKGNEYYYDAEHIGPDRLIFRFGADAAALFAAYNNGEIDFLHQIPGMELPTLLRSGAVKVLPQTGTSYIAFNTAQSPFTDARLRQALSLAIDRDYVTEFVLQGGQQEAGALIPPLIAETPEAGMDFRAAGGDFINTDFEDHQQNCEQARSLLAAAGFVEGADFPTIRFVFPAGELNRAIAEAVAYMWLTELGIATELVSMDADAYGEAISAGDYSLTLRQQTAYLSDAFSFVQGFSSQSRQAPPGFNDAELDAAISAAAVEADAVQRADLLHQAERLIMERSLIAPLYFSAFPSLLRPDISGLCYAPQGIFLFSYCQETP